MISGNSAKIAVVIPCYRAKQKILGVLAKIGTEVDAIYVIDDGCPEGTGDFIEQEVHDKRVQLIRCERNGGVGAATLIGMSAAMAAGATVLVKIDGDGQMDTDLIASVVTPILDGSADYTKGNRFYSPEFVRGMPMIRLFGNGILSFLTKMSSGYWTIFDPTNGFVAIHASVFSTLPRQKLASRFFFESDLLFRLNLLRANVVDIPMPATYGDESSNLSVGRIIVPFIWGHVRNTIKRIIYSYLVRDFSIASIYLMFGIPLFLFGVLYGADQWIAHARSGTIATAGTVMVAALPVITGFQLILSFLAFDIATVPRTAIHPLLCRNDKAAYSVVNTKYESASPP